MCMYCGHGYTTSEQLFNHLLVIIIIIIIIWN